MRLRKRAMTDEQRRERELAKLTSALEAAIHSTRNARIWAGEDVIGPDVVAVRARIEGALASLRSAQRLTDEVRIALDRVHA